MEFKGTKGEWNTVKSNRVIYVESKDNVLIAELDNVKTLGFEQATPSAVYHNAKLISCSPELLKMHIDDLDFLEKWLKSMENHNYDEVSAREIKDTITVKKDLIKKALGE